MSLIPGGLVYFVVGAMRLRALTAKLRNFYGNTKMALKSGKLTLILVKINFSEK